VPQCAASQFALRLNGIDAALGDHAPYERLNEPQEPTRPPMTLANMREQGVQHLIGFCHNDACRHSALIDVSSYPALLC
jgi:hypothetical protein